MPAAFHCSDHGSAIGTICLGSSLILDEDSGMQWGTKTEREMKKTILQTWMNVALGAVLLGAAVASGAVVTPNPLSPLKNKKVMVLEGSDGGHAGPKGATWTNLQALAKTVGF